METYVPRAIEDPIRCRLGQGKAIVIYGPRQAGKTTLAKRILRNYEPETVVEFNCDDPSQAALFEPNVQKLGMIVRGKKALFIDEAQAIENTGLVLKLLVDHFSETQVIATGSSSFELSDKIKEAMTGRAHAFTLLPLSALELAPDGKSRLLFDINRVLTLGSYPEVVLSNEQDAVSVLRSITEGYLYKDLLNLADIRHDTLLGRLLTALALQVGQEVSYHELAGLLEVNRLTIERYITLLEQAFIVFRLQPLSSNPRKLLASRKRKVYFYDLGVRSALAGQLDVPLAANQLLGGIFENFCVLERLKQKNARQLSYNEYYWRSPDSEVDYVEQRGSQTAAYEIKWKKLAKNPPPRFRRQFPEASFTPITQTNFWQLLDA